MKMRALLRAGAVVSSVTLASGVIWWGVHQARAQQQTADGSGTQPAMILPGSKSKTIALPVGEGPPATKPAQQPILMEGSKSGYMVSPLPTPASPPTTAPASAPAGASGPALRPLTPAERTLLIDAL